MLTLPVQRYKKANVTHPELGVTVQLPIISVKKVCNVKRSVATVGLTETQNPQNPMYTQLGVLTKGTIIEVNGTCFCPHSGSKTVLTWMIVSELGLVTTGGKVVWGRWAQIMNAPENDGCVNA